MHKRKNENLAFDFQNLYNKDKKNKDIFISYFQKDITMQIEYNKLYYEFQDKLPLSEDIAYLALEDFTEKFKKDICLKTSDFFKKLIEITNAFINNYIKDSIHNQLKNICQRIYQGSEKAQEELRDFEKNILFGIEINPNRIFRFFKYSNHIKVAKKVVEDLLNLAKAHGSKDKKGKEIRDYCAFINTIISRKILDEIRHETFIIYKDEFFNFIKDRINPEKGIEEEIDNKVFFKKLNYFIENGLQNLNSEEKYLFNNHFIEGKKLKDIGYEMKKIFHKDFSPAKLTYIKNKVVKKIKEFLDFQRPMSNGLNIPNL